MRYKPFVLITTPIGVIWGIYEGFKLAGAAAMIIIAQVVILSVAFFYVIRAIRKDKRAKESASSDDK